MENLSLNRSTSYGARLKEENPEKYALYLQRQRERATSARKALKTREKKSKLELLVEELREKKRQKDQGRRVKRGDEANGPTTRASSRSTVESPLRHRRPTSCGKQLEDATGEKLQENGRLCTLQLNKLSSNTMDNLSRSTLYRVRLKEENPEKYALYLQRQRERATAARKALKEKPWTREKEIKLEEIREKRRLSDQRRRKKRRDEANRSTSRRPTHCGKQPKDMTEEELREHGRLRRQHSREQESVQKRRRNKEKAKLRMRALRASRKAMTLSHSVFFNNRQKDQGRRVKRGDEVNGPTTRASSRSTVESPLKHRGPTSCGKQPEDATGEKLREFGRLCTLQLNKLSCNTMDNLSRSTLYRGRLKEENPEKYALYLQQQRERATAARKALKEMPWTREKESKLEEMREKRRLSDQRRRKKRRDEAKGSTTRRPTHCGKQPKDMTEEELREHGRLLRQHSREQECGQKRRRNKEKAKLRMRTLRASRKAMTSNPPQDCSHQSGDDSMPGQLVSEEDSTVAAGTSTSLEASTRRDPTSSPLTSSAPQ